MPAAGLTKRVREVPISQEADDGLRERAGLIGGYGETGALVLHGVRESTDVRRDERLCHEQRLDGAAEIVAERTLHRDIERGEQVGNVLPLARENDGVAHAEIFGEFFQGLFVFESIRAPSAADEQELRAREFFQNELRSAYQHFMTLD
ncbi:MAG TPA: hypothetical protein VL284_14275, partial [Thermoanaerobaculia bacterium]|nr:hypothetical protein [Thermoanaerobaculia bacterium]